MIYKGGVVRVAKELHRLVALISVWVDNVMRSALYSNHDIHSS